MKRHFYLCFLSITIFYYCGAQNSTEERCPAIREIAVYNNGWILTDTLNMFKHLTKTEVKGNGTVFRYTKMFDCPDALDEEHEDILTWYIDDNISAFELILKGHPKQLKYNFSNYNPDADESLQSVLGTIKGNKIDNEWIISGTVTITAIYYRRIYIRKLNFTRSFVKTDYKEKDLIAD